MTLASPGWLRHCGSSAQRASGHRCEGQDGQESRPGLAQLHAAGLLTGVWIPPVEVRELRAVIAQRAKMVRMATQAKNRLARF